MGLSNRPYWRDEQEGGFGGGGGVAVGMPRPTRVVKFLLLLNAAVFVIQIFVEGKPTGRPGPLSEFFGITVGSFWQVWRYLSFQFLHDTKDIFHILLNMLGLYMLGTPLEGRWGSRRFLAFYLTCGVAAGVAYVALMRLLTPPAMWDWPLIGASGGVYGIVLACAVLFPHFQIILLVFPVPIRLAAIIIFSVMAFSVTAAIRTPGAMPWGDVAHLGGALAAGCWLLLSRVAGGRWEALGNRRRQGAWRRKMQEQAQEQAKIDRILQKIHDQGLQSLSGKERKLLADASRNQRENENRF